MNRHVVRCLFKYTNLFYIFFSKLIFELKEISYIKKRSSNLIIANKRIVFQKKKVFERVQCHILIKSNNPTQKE